MLNPELKKMYSECVIASLEMIAKYFETKNVVAYVYNKKTYKGITEPVAIIFDEPKLDYNATCYVEKACRLYVDQLKPEDREMFITPVTVGKKAIWADIVREKTPLWI